MKYFAVAVIIALFALSQAMPVEEKEKRSFVEKLLSVFNDAKSTCERIVSRGDAGPWMMRACGCVRSAGHIGGWLGDESHEEKRIFGDTLKMLVSKARKLINKLCENPATEKFQDVCTCIQF